MRSWILSALVIAVAFAGCASNEPAEEPTPSATSSTSSTGTTSTTSSASSTTSTQTGAPPANRPPTAALAADAVQGSAPFLVNFTIDGQDADADNLTWVLSFGDASSNETGQSVPANVTHTFPQGNFTVVLTVSDGVANASANLTIAVTAGAPAAAFTPIHAEHDVFYFCELCTQDGPSFCIGFNADVQDVDCGWIDLPPEAAGRAYTVATAGLMFGNPDIGFLASCAPDAAVISMHTGASTETGLVPPGAGCLVFWDFDGVEVLLPFLIDIV